MHEEEIPVLQESNLAALLDRDGGRRCIHKLYLYVGMGGWNITRARIIITALQGVHIN
jgi:hypothetical protein